MMLLQGGGHEQTQTRQAAVYARRGGTAADAAEYPG